MRDERHSISESVAICRYLESIVPEPNLFGKDSFDTIISTECFEHDPEYRESLLKICEMLKPDGLFVFTCASTGRPEHGTRRTSQQDSYGSIAELEDMQDYYRNLTIEERQKAFLSVPIISKSKDDFSSWNSTFSRVSVSTTSRFFFDTIFSNKVLLINSSGSNSKILFFIFRNNLPPVFDL